MNTTSSNASTRPVSIPHLVFGIVFTGIAAITFIGESTNADLPKSAIGFPIVLIGAGIIGLVATLVNARRRSRSAYAPTAFEAPAATEETIVLDDDTATTSDASTEATTVINKEQS